MKHRIYLILVLLAGCGSPATSPVSEADAPANAAAIPAPSKPEPPPEIQFDDAAGAIAALTKAAGERDSDTLIAAENWLVEHGEQAAAPVGDIFRDDAGDIASRIAACRVLRRLDSKWAKEPLLAGLESTSQQIRLNAIKGLGLIEPTDDQIIGQLAGLLDAEDQRVQREAILALGNVGPAANATVGDRLVSILNDAAENETLRDAAKRALEEVNPRRTFQD